MTKTMVKKITEIFTWVVLPMIAGAIIYLFSRSNSIFFIGWVNHFLNYSFEKIELPFFIKYNLVDGIWTFSLTSLILIIWDWDLYKIKLWIILVILLTIFLEMKFGTFDYIDLLISLLGILSPILYTLINNFKFKFYEQKIN